MISGSSRHNISEQILLWRQVTDSKHPLPHRLLCDCPPFEFETTHFQYSDEPTTILEDCTIA